LTTLRDALSEALGSAEAGTLQAPVENTIETTTPEPVVQETAEAKAERLRDEGGRFARNELKEPTAPVQPVETPAARKPPSSWKKDYWGHWDRLGTDPELSKLQDYIEQREADYAKGVSTYKGQWDQAAPLMEAIQPFIPELQQHGIQPQQWIQNLGSAHRALALGSPEQKLQMFAKLATDYGIPLQALQGGQVDPQFSHVTQTVSQLQNQMHQIQTAREQERQTVMQQQIEAFAKTHPLFEKARPHMAPLLQSGLATDLETAYQKAIRLDDELWQQHQAEQAKSAETARQAAIAQKKAAAVSPRSSGPTGQMAAGNTQKSLRDQLSAAIDGASSGRF
jgi:hypothetical protein